MERQNYWSNLNSQEDGGVGGERNKGWRKEKEREEMCARSCEGTFILFCVCGIDVKLNLKKEVIKIFCYLWRDKSCCMR